jgi:hypothetical protein
VVTVLSIVGREMALCIPLDPSAHSGVSRAPIPVQARTWGESITAIFSAPDSGCDRKVSIA